MSQATSMRKRHRFNSRMTRIVLLISFIFFWPFYLLVRGAWQDQDKKKLSESTLSVDHRYNVSGYLLHFYSQS